jgi:hypothetical protein
MSGNMIAVGELAFATFANWSRPVLDTVKQIDEPEGLD